MTADSMYSRQSWEKLPQQVQTLLFQKLKTFSHIFIDFYNLHKGLGISKKTISFLA